MFRAHDAARVRDSGADSGSRDTARGIPLIPLTSHLSRESHQKFCRLVSPRRGDGAGGAGAYGVGGKGATIAMGWNGTGSWRRSIHSMPRSAQSRWRRRLRGRATQIVRGLLDPEALARLSGELTPHLEATELGDPDTFFGHKTKRFGALLSRCPMTRDMVVHPLLLAVVDRVLGPYCARYRIHYTGVMHVEPGESGTGHASGHRPLSHPEPGAAAHARDHVGGQRLLGGERGRPASCRGATAGPTSAFRSRARSRRPRCRRARC